MGRKKILGSDHLNTLKVINDLNELSLIMEVKENESQKYK
jgi:hypothetical protein